MIQKSSCFVSVSETLEHSTENHIWPTAASNEMFASLGNPIKTVFGLGKKGQKDVRQKQKGAGTVLALSSPFANRETFGKVVRDA